MLGNKLISFLNLLTSKEMDLLSKFLASPYHNEQEKLIQLFEIIKPFLKAKKPLPSKTDIWTKLFPKKPYNDIKIRKLTSTLLDLSISFKAHELLYEQKEQKLILDLKAVSHPKLQTHIASISRKIHKAFQNNQLSAEVHFHQYEFEAQKHRILEKEKDLKKIIKLENLQNANRHLDLFYYSKKLEITADALGYHGFNEALEDMSSKDLIANNKDNPLFQKATIRVYYLIVQMLSEPNKDEHFYRLKTWLNKNNKSFSKEQNKTYYTHLLNFCSQMRINAGDHSFHKEVFSIFKIMINQSLIFDPYLEPIFYRNIISNSVALKEYDYAQNFITKYSEFLPPDQKENAKTYNLARLYYTQKKFGKVIGLLQNVELTNINYSLGAKTILVGTYYALDEIRALESLLISFRIFVLRNKLISNKGKQGYLNFLKYTKKLIFLAPFDKAAKEKLKEKITNNKNLMLRDWLLEQIQ